MIYNYTTDTYIAIATNRVDALAVRHRNIKNPVDRATFIVHINAAKAKLLEAFNGSVHISLKDPIPFDLPEFNSEDYSLDWLDKLALKVLPKNAHVSGLIKDADLRIKKAKEVLDN